MIICVCHVKSYSIYLPTYLLDLSQCYDGDFDTIRHLHIFVHAAMALQQPARLLQHLFYFIAHETRA